MSLCCEPVSVIGLLGPVHFYHRALIPYRRQGDGGFHEIPPHRKSNPSSPPPFSADSKDLGQESLTVVARRRPEWGRRSRRPVRTRRGRWGDAPATRRTPLATRCRSRVSRAATAAQAGGGDDPGVGRCLAGDRLDGGVGVRPGGLLKLPRERVVDAGVAGADDEQAIGVQSGADGLPPAAWLALGAARDRRPGSVSPAWSLLRAVRSSPRTTTSSPPRSRGVAKPWASTGVAGDHLRWLAVGQRGEPRPLPGQSRSRGRFYIVVSRCGTP